MELECDRSMFGQTDKHPDNDKGHCGKTGEWMEFKFLSHLPCGVGVSSGLGLKWTFFIAVFLQ